MTDQQKNRKGADLIAGRYAQPMPTQNKLSRLRVKATGQRRKTGPKTGTSPSPNQGKGVRTRQVPALQEVYTREELPQARALPELPAGEKRRLAQTETIDYVQRLEQSPLLLRSRKPAVGPGGVNLIKRPAEESRKGADLITGR